MNPRPFLTKCYIKDGYPSLAISPGMVEGQ